MANRTSAVTVKGVFEGVIWQSRLIIVLAVVASLLSAIMISVMATGGVFKLTWTWLQTFFQGGQVVAVDSAFHSQVVTQATGTVVDFLLAMLLFIMAWGLYELFISKLSSNGSMVHQSSNILLIRDLDDLKDRVIKVVMLILVVLFFDHALHTKVTEAISFLYLGGGILMVALALFLSNRSDFTHGKK